MKIKSVIAKSFQAYSKFLKKLFGPDFETSFFWKRFFALTRLTDLKVQISRILKTLYWLF